MLITLQKNILKGSERKIKKIVRMVIQKNYGMNVHLTNVLDADV